MKNALQFLVPRMVYVAFISVIYYGFRFAIMRDFPPLDAMVVFYVGVLFWYLVFENFGHIRDFVHTKFFKKNSNS